MARYFFHLRDGVDILLDEEGRDFASLAAAAAAALIDARAIISHDALAGHLKLDQRIDVEDDGGAIVHSLAFVDAITIVMPD